GPEETKHLVDHVATALMWVMLITCVAGIVAT
ncbi:unnamed protein product, partial [marine sediment metagenome]